MTAETQNKSRRIASNTLVLTMRMIVITIVNLVAVRLVLGGLGETDYGIFSTVAGVVLLSSFFSATLSVAVQRFYSYAMGENDNETLRQVFPASVNLIVALCLIVLLVAETVGLWFVFTQLTIPAERMTASLVIYQFSLMTLLLSFLQIPFSAAMFANEEMGLYAVVSTIECFLRLAAAWLIGTTAIDNLVFYSGGLLITSVLIFATYVVIARRRYMECRYGKVTDRTLYWRIASFSGWTLFGSAAHTAQLQGSVILLNIFFGPVITAAFAIAQQISNAFNTLCANVVIAFRPAMIKCYAEKDYGYLNRMFNFSNKFILYILLAIALPIYAEMDVILRLWLGDDVSHSAVLFSRLIIIYIVCLNLHSPITIIMQAMGRIKEYHLPVESTALLCLPVAWGLFRMGCPAESILYSIIGLCIVAHVIRLLCIRKYYEPFSLKDYLLGFLFRGVLVVVVAALAIWGVKLVTHGTVLQFFAVVSASSVSLFLMVFSVGTSAQEREMCKQFVMSLRRKDTKMKKS